MNYYNEIDPQKSAWLRELIKTNVVSEGIVDERSITEIEPSDLSEFAQCHFFAGIGIWSYTLRIAGWADDKRVWTGSCPCQPFSNAGKRKGEMDERHLWPAWFRLITECGPGVLFGEQVADGDGIAWLDNVQTDLETENYRVGPCVLPAAGFGAPHGRHRLYFVADTQSKRNYSNAPRRIREQSPQSKLGSTACDMADAGQEFRRSGSEHSNGENTPERCATASNLEHGGHTCGLADSEMSKRGRSGNETNEGRGIEEVGGPSSVGDLGHSEETRLQGQPEMSQSSSGECVIGQAGPVSGFWADAEWLWCRPEPGYPEGRYRAAKPGIFPLAHGTPARILRLRGYGDGITPQVAAEFIKAYQEITQRKPHS